MTNFIIEVHYIWTILACTHVLQTTEYYGTYFAYFFFKETDGYSLWFTALNLLLLLSSKQACFVAFLFIHIEMMNYLDMRPRSLGADQSVLRLLPLQHNKGKSEQDIIFQALAYPTKTPSAGNPRLCPHTRVGKCKIVRSFVKSVQ
jgi:hypothetical protein